MSIFSFISDIFKPAADLVDNLHDSDEEMGNIEVKKQELRNELAKMEYNLSTKYVELQTQAMEAQAKMEIAAQQHGNFLSKSWRPITSLIMAATLFGMGLGFIEYNQMITQIAGGFLGIYGLGRSVEKSVKK